MSVVTATTHGVKVSVSTQYQEGHSNPQALHCVFIYQISIENHSEYTVQLLRRHWHIYDGTGIQRQVEGEGVVGQQPILEPGQSHVYVSGCNIRSGIGKMVGRYQMQRLIDGHLFEVAVPEFVMAVPFRLN